MKKKSTESWHVQNMLFIKKFDFKVVTKWLRRKKKVWDELVMKSHLLSIFNFSSWYGQKNCIKTKYIYKKIFYYQKKNNIRYVPEMGTFNYAKKYMSVTLINFIDRSWCTSAPHKTREQTSWSKVRPRD